MSYEADLIADRRRLRGRLSFWRILAFVAMVALLIIGGVSLGSDQLSVMRPHVARVVINGLITGDQRTLDLIDDVRRENSVQAVIIRIESPGGTTAGSEAIYDSLRQLSAEKPVVAVVDSLAASGGYIAALGADYIVARKTSLVGSIGVLVQYPNVTNLLETIGVSVEEVKSSPLKAAPNGYTPTTPQARAALQSLVDDSFNWFKGLVRERRGYSDADLALVSDGRVFTGRQGIDLKLVDQLGGEREAIAWLTAERNISESASVREWKRRPKDSALNFLGSAASIAEIAGLEKLSSFFNRLNAAAGVQRLDGLLALWQPHFEK